MEVLTCSGAHCVGESDCTQQGSGKAFMYDEKSNCLENGRQVQEHMKVNDLVLKVDEPRLERQGEAQWTVDDSHNSECQKLYCDSQDSEDDDLDSEDQSTGPCFVSKSSLLIVDTIESCEPSHNSVGDYSLTEFKWLEQDESLAVWVKCRGKWQAGIKCMRADWPLPTLKAKPTHDRKKYIMIFFPRTRNYSWVDVVLVRPINEFPQPIAYKTHEFGVKIVKDLILARRFIMQRLAVSMLSIMDQLHTEALVETARNVIVWKEFAMEASRCKGYSDLGRVLLKLQNRILRSCLSSDWLQNSFLSWMQRCQNADSAESVEMLKEELADSILWNEVNSLSDIAVQCDWSSEWKTWMHEVMKWFSMSHPISSGGEIEQLGNITPLPMGLQISRKRPKLEIRRADTHASQVETHDSHPSKTIELDARFFNSRDVNAGSLEFEHSRNEIVVDAGNPEAVQTKDVEVTPVNRKPLDSANKTRQCIAFIEAKGRQCVRWANDGHVYCCVHSRFVDKSAKSEATFPLDAPMCEGTTVLSTKCKHRSLLGSSFCKKHIARTDTKITSSSIDNKLKRKHEESINGSESTYCKNIVLVGETDTPLQVAPISVMGGEAFNGQCIGSCPHEGSDHCLETPKRHSLYCEKHIPSWLKRARNGKSRIIPKEVFLDLLKDCYSWEQKLHLHQACELFYGLFKSILSPRNHAPKEIQLQWAISEASKDSSVGGFLMKLVCSEKERLGRLWGFNAYKDTKVSSSVDEPVSMTVDNESDHDIDDVIKCKICSGNFLDDQTLGAHWMDRHRKEAHWLFRGYVCAICFNSCTNREVLETHVKERHQVQFVEQCTLFQCIPCGAHFGNHEQLWLHVQSVHPSDLRLPRVAIQQHSFPLIEDSSQKRELENSNSIENDNSESQVGFHKFICRFCGLKFDLLLNLGRHHQAAHMGQNSVSPQAPKRDISLYAYRLKSGRLSRPRLRKGLGGASYRMRKRGDASLKKHVSTGIIKMQSRVPETGGLGRLEESQCSTAAKLLFSRVQRTKPRPNNLDILYVARSACCKVILQASLEEKFGLLPERLYLKAAKLCSEQNILVDWHQEGFVCPRGCKPITDSQVVSSLMPRSDGAVVPRSAIPSDRINNEWEMDECHYIISSRHFKQESMQKTIILCDDISFGQEKVPIACVVDEYLLGSIQIVTDSSDGQTTANSMPWKSFTYVMKSLLDQSLCPQAESLQLGCTCTQSTCSPETCDHVYLFDNDYEDAKDIHGKPMHGRFPYDVNGRIILEEGYLVYECNHMCSCTRSCQNRVLQNGVQVKLEVFKTEKKGWAVRACETILRGTFVCEFIGEVIDEQKSNERRNRYGREGCRYFSDIDADINDMSRLIEGQVTYVIDATNYGNVSRYINHSCLPNLVNHQVLVESMDCQLAHIGLFASRDIAVGEELTYDYRYKLVPGEGCSCHCGASNCRGRLY